MESTTPSGSRQVQLPYYLLDALLHVEHKDRLAVFAWALALWNEGRRAKPGGLPYSRDWLRREYKLSWRWLTNDYPAAASAALSLAMGMEDREYEEEEPWPEPLAVAKERHETGLWDHSGKPWAQRPPRLEGGRIHGGARLKFKASADTFGGNTKENFRQYLKVPVYAFTELNLQEVFALFAIQRHPRSSGRLIARRFGVEKSRFNRRLQSLRKEGVVCRKSGWWTVDWSLFHEVKKPAKSKAAAMLLPLGGHSILDGEAALN